MSLEIRPCQPSDVNQVIPLMFSSGPDAFRYVFSIQHQEQVSEFLHFAYCQGDGEFGYKDHQVAVIEGKIVGLVGTRHGKDNFKYMLAAIKQIFGFYGLINGLKVLVRGLQFERIVAPPKSHQLCLHNLGVSAESRGQGIGNKLIEHFLQQAKENRIEEVTLDVAQTNPRAKALYSRLGFNVESYKKGGFSNKFGKAVDHETMVIAPQE